MERVGFPSDDDPELHLLTEWDILPDPARRRRAAALSAAAHLVLIGVLWMVPADVLEEPPRRAELSRVTPLVEPPPELTQTAPNTKKITKEFKLPNVEPRPRIQIPKGAPSTTRPLAPRPAEVPTPTPRPTSLPEPPKLEAGAPRSDLPSLPQVPPQIQPVERAQSPLENLAPPPAPVPPGRGRVPIPNPSVSEAIRQSVRGGSGGGLTVGDPDLSGPGGIGEGVNLPPTPGVEASQLELLSDPQGVDFRPYLIQVLAAVRRNWLAVLPESARMGRQGRVGIQFSIARNGNVPKLVITSGSGTDALDRAAVAGISASQVFPPFPTGFKGDRVVLQFNFAYNMPRR
jgi:TonB family protein